MKFQNFNDLEKAATLALSRGNKVIIDLDLLKLSIIHPRAI